MKTKPILLLTFVLTLIIFSGCSNNGMFLALNQTSVELSEPNYQIIAKGVTGESQAGYLFGASFSFGSATETFALFRVNGTGMLYKEAMANIWKNYEEKHSPIEGEKVALINVHYDTDILNLLVYTQVKIFIRADVVEFKD